MIEAKRLQRCHRERESRRDELRARSVELLPDDQAIAGEQPPRWFKVLENHIRVVDEVSPEHHGDSGREGGG